MKNPIKQKWFILAALGAALAPWQALALSSAVEASTNITAKASTDGVVGISSNTPTQIISSNGRVECQSTSGSCPDYTRSYTYSDNSNYSDRMYYRNTDDRRTGYRMSAEANR